MKATLLGIDAGTTGVTVILYDEELRPLRRAYSEFEQHYPQPGRVEHDANEIAEVVLRLVRDVTAEPPAPVAGVGITNQRETLVALDADTGRPLARAIVWQCRRSSEICAQLRSDGHEAAYRDATGLLLDPYFSGTKMRWLLENDQTVSAAARAGRLRLVTVDAFLVHLLTGGRVLATDPTNASRTLVYDIHERAWSTDLMGPLGVDQGMMSEVRPSAGDFGVTDVDRVGFAAPITGVVGDQQAALFGQGCHAPGTAKNTYGTGCFLLVNAGTDRPTAPDGVLTTLAAGPTGEAVYALEGSVFVAGAAVQWLRDELGLIGDAAETAALAASLDDNGGVYLVPAFTGLGAPWWDPDARGVLCGLTRGSSRAHIARAALESIAYQTSDLFALLKDAAGHAVNELRVDGGAARNDWLMQFQADVLGAPVTRGEDLETTCRGAALLAGVGVGVVSDPCGVAALAEDRSVFQPTMDRSVRDGSIAMWHQAVRRARSDIGP
ncbi:MAG: glycerol kinase [Planctomycetes bacterium]|nr:glycerol kinase [Planctomycetota bacterium]